MVVLISYPIHVHFINCLYIWRCILINVWMLTCSTPVFILLADFSKLFDLLRGIQNYFSLFAALPGCNVTLSSSLPFLSLSCHPRRSRPFLSPEVWVPLIRQGNVGSAERYPLGWGWSPRHKRIFGWKTHPTTVIWLYIKPLYLHLSM